MAIVTTHKSKGVGNHYEMSLNVLSPLSKSVSGGLKCWDKGSMSEWPRNLVHLIHFLYSGVHRIPRSRTCNTADTKSSYWELEVFFVIAVNNPLLGTKQAKKNKTHEVYSG